MIKNYEDLDVYKRSYKLSLEINELSDKLPKKEQYNLADQIRRASRSIPSNIAEGFGRKRHVKEFVNFLHMALGSNDEMLFNIRLMKDLKYISLDEYGILSQEYVIVGKQLTSLIKSWKKFITD